jgi:hypothetical protein
LLAGTVRFAALYLIFYTERAAKNYDSISPLTTEHIYVRFNIPWGIVWVLCAFENISHPVSVKVLSDQERIEHHV